MPGIRSPVGRGNRQAPQPRVSPSGSPQVSGVWDTVFQERREVDLTIEDTPCINVLARLEKGEPGTATNDVGLDNPIRQFMKSPDESDACMPRADRVEAVCAGADIRQLMDAAGPGNQNTVALIDERTFTEGDESVSRTPRGPLTSHQLCLCLRERVGNPIFFNFASEDAFARPR